MLRDTMRSVLTFPWTTAKAGTAWVLGRLPWVVMAATTVCVFVGVLDWASSMLMNIFMFAASAYGHAKEAAERADRIEDTLYDMQPTDTGEEDGLRFIAGDWRDREPDRPTPIMPNPDHDVITDPARLLGASSKDSE